MHSQSLRQSQNSFLNPLENLTPRSEVQKELFGLEKSPTDQKKEDMLAYLEAEVSHLWKQKKEREAKDKEMSERMEEMETKLEELEKQTELV